MGRILLALSAVGLALLFHVQAESYPATAARMPNLVGYFVMFMAALAIGQQLLHWRRQSGEGTFVLATPPSPAALRIGALFIALIVVYVAVMPHVGYLAATAVFLFLPMAALRPASWPMIALTIVLVLGVIWTVFIGFLGLPIPFTFPERDVMNEFFWIGLENVVQPRNIIAILGGTVIGMFVGAMPGLSATMAIALLLPITFALDPATGLSMLAAIYIAAMYGGSIAAILLRTPGTPAAAATLVDGYPMAQRGQAGRALGLSLWASLIGGLISSVALLTVAPLLGALVLNFGPVEFFAIAVLGMTIIASLSQGSTILGLLSGAVGLLIATVGMDPTTGTPRFTFGVLDLFSGVNFTVALIGLFSIPQAIRLLIKGNDDKGEAIAIRDSILLSWVDNIKHMANAVRSSVIGVFVGLIPGTGGDTACWFAYSEAKRFSKHKEKFGTGYEPGVVAPEAANNAVVGGALIPTIALGIPGSSSTAVLLGGLMVHGILPGPGLMTDHGDVTYTLLWAVLFGNIAMFGVGLMFTRLAVGVTKIPNRMVAPVIVALSVIGAFAINNSIFDVGLMIAFGMIGLAMEEFGIPTPPLVIGLILGPVLDTSLQQSLLIGNGDWMIFLKSPIAAVLLALAVLSLLQAVPFGKLAGLARSRRAGDA